MLPCVQQAVDHKLGLVYKRTTKQQPAELFVRKTTEGEFFAFSKHLPDYSKVVDSIAKISGTIPTNVTLLEEKFGNLGTVVVRSEKNSSPAEKQVSYSVVERYTHLGKLYRFFIFQLSNLWRKATCGLAINLLWTSKQRSGVAVNLAIRE